MFYLNVVKIWKLSNLFTFLLISLENQDEVDETQVRMFHFMSTNPYAATKAGAEQLRNLIIILIKCQLLFQEEIMFMVKSVS